MQIIFVTAVVSAVYFFSGKLMAPLSLVESSSVFAVWPPTGVALAAFLLYGYRSWIGVMLGALLLNMTLTPFLPSLQIALTNTAGPLLAAWILLSYVKHFDFFRSVYSMILFFVAITLASLVTATGGSMALLMHGYVGSEELRSVLYTWFLGDLIGFLVITPLAVAWKLESSLLFSERRWWEVFFLALVFTAAGVVFFGPFDLFDRMLYPVEYMLFLPVLWASIRFGALGGSFSVAAATLLVILGTINYYGSFIRTNPNDTLVLLQGYVWFMAVIALFSATILRQKEVVQASLIRAGRELEKNAMEWKDTLDQVNDVVYILDLDRHLIRANKTFYQMMQTTPEAAVGKHIVGIVHPGGELIPCPVCQAQEAKRDAVITMEPENPDNPSGRPIEITVKMIHDAEENPSAILMTIHDLTQSRQMDEQLKLAATVFESTAEGLLITDASQHILAANRAASEITGYEKEMLVAMVTPLFRHTLASDPQKPSIIDAIAQEGFWRGEIEVQNSAGDPLPLWVHVNTVKEGKIIYYVILFLDITERKAAEAAIDRYQRTLEQRVEAELAKRKEQEQILIQQSKLAAMGEMVGMIAHQWRQPLSALGLLIQDIPEAYEFGELDKRYIDQNVSASMKLLKHMSSTIDDFRNFFKQDQDKQYFMIRDIIDSVLTVIGASLKNNDIELILPEVESEEIYGYFREYTQAVLNIINNAKDALKRSKKEKKWIRIEWLKTKEGRIRLMISDNGGGIPEAIMEKIYDPYFTTKEQGHGTGIGLYMSKMIIERHMQGILSSENTDEGARFIIEV